jgi:hypothetical protein
MGFIVPQEYVGVYNKLTDDTISYCDGRNCEFVVSKNNLS